MPGLTASDANHRTTNAWHRLIRTTYITLFAVGVLAALHL